MTLVNIKPILDKANYNLRSRIKIGKSMLPEITIDLNKACLQTDNITPEKYEELKANSITSEEVFDDKKMYSGMSKVGQTLNAMGEVAFSKVEENELQEENSMGKSM